MSKITVASLADIVAQLAAAQAAQAAMLERLIEQTAIRPIEGKCEKQERRPMRQPRREDFDLDTERGAIQYRAAIKRYNAEADFRRAYYSNH